MTPRRLFYSAAVIGLLLFVGWFFKDNVLTEGWLGSHPMRRSETEIKPLYDKLLLLRREWANGPLLLKVLDEDIVVRYHFDTKKSEKVDVKTWHSAAGVVTVCGGSFGVPAEEEVEKYDTYGKYALDGAFSATGSRLAMISAYGPKMPSISLMPGLGGGRNIWGQRYLEIKEGKPPYSNLRKPIRAANDRALCWTDEEDAVVYFDQHYFFSFSVLALNDNAPVGEPPTVGPYQVETGTPPPDLSRFTGRFRDYGVDSDGDGFFEKVAIDVETETTMPGRYKIFLGLVSADGKHAGGTAEPELKGGIETTTLRFDTEDWYHRGVEGEMIITSAQLDYGNGPNIENRENFGRTKEYSTDSFKRDTIIFTGEQQYKLVDPDRSGRFRALEFLVGVETLNEGEYEYSGDLYYEEWTSTADGVIEFAHGRTYLRKGKNFFKIRFSGKNILRYGKEGRFQLHSILIHEKGKKGRMRNTLPLTRRFELTEFSPD